MFRSAVPPSWSTQARSGTSALPSAPVHGPRSSRVRPTARRSARADRLDLTRTPCLGEEGLQRVVQPQDHEPALAGHRLDPVAPLYPVGLLRSEVDGGRSVGVRLRGRRRVTLAAGPRIALRRVEHRARHGVVQRQRPEVRFRNALRQRQSVCSTGVSAETLAACAASGAGQLPRE